MATMFIPPVIQDEIDGLREGCQQEPVVEQVRRQTYRVTLDNGRVRMYVDYRYLGPGRAALVGSKLWIDGEPSPLADGPRHFFAIWNGASWLESRKEHEIREAPANDLSMPNPELLAAARGGGFRRLNRQGGHRGGTWATDPRGR